jgi:hypothetical protein
MNVCKGFTPLGDKATIGQKQTVSAVLISSDSEFSQHVAEYLNAHQYKRYIVLKGFLLRNIYCPTGIDKSLSRSLQHS